MSGRRIRYLGLYLDPQRVYEVRLYSGAVPVKDLSAHTHAWQVGDLIDALEDALSGDETRVDRARDYLAQLQYNGSLLDDD